MTRARLAAFGFVLAAGAILLHWTGFGYDEVRRPWVVLAAALVFAAGANRGSSRILLAADAGLLAAALSALFAVNRTEAVAALFPLVVAWMFLRGTASGRIPRVFLERHGLFILSWIGILFSGYGLLQSGGFDVLGLGVLRESILPVSTVGNTNYAGVLAAVFSLIGLASALYEPGRRRFPGAAAALLGALFTGATGSFGGLLGLFAGATMFTALRIHRDGGKPVAFIPLALVVFALVPMAARVAERTGDIARGEDRTGNVRLGLWRGTLRLAVAHPLLGCGPGNFRMEFPPFRDAEERALSHQGQGLSYVEAEDPHNTYLAALAESGPIALLALAIVAAGALRAGIRRAREPDPPTAALAIAATAGLTALAVSAMFNSLAGHLPFAILAGVLAGAAYPADPAPMPAGHWLRWCVAGLIAIAPMPWFIADVQYREAMFMTGLPETRIYHLQSALDALPGHWQARLAMASTWRRLGQNEGSVRAHLREVLRVHPHQVSAMIELSASLPPAEEEEWLKRAEAIAPEFALVHTRLAGVDIKRRDYASARRRVEKILVSLPDEPEALYTMGRIWLMDPKYEEALPWLKRATSANPRMRERLAEDHPELKNDARFVGLLGP